ncbi:MAG: hypothetical protein V3V46_07860, partial [Anaerolineales bacterium]
AASIGILEESNSTMAELCDVILTARVAEEHNAVGGHPACQHTRTRGGRGCSLRHRPVSAQS